jgi:hypothetical protein
VPVRAQDSRQIKYRDNNIIELLSVIFHFVALDSEPDSRCTKLSGVEARHTESHPTARFHGSCCIWGRIHW